MNETQTFSHDDHDRLRAFLREQAAEEGLSIAAWCRARNISHSYVSNFLSGRKPPGPLLLKALGFRLAWTIEPKKRGRPTTKHAPPARSPAGSDS